MKASPKSAKITDEFGSSYVAEPAVVIAPAGKAISNTDLLDYSDGEGDDSWMDTPDGREALCQWLQEGLEYDKKHPKTYTMEEFRTQMDVYLDELGRKTKSKKL